MPNIRSSILRSCSKGSPNPTPSICKLTWIITIYVHMQCLHKCWLLPLPHRILLLCLLYCSNTPWTEQAIWKTSSSSCTYTHFRNRCEILCCVPHRLTAYNCWGIPQMQGDKFGFTASWQESLTSNSLFQWQHPVCEEQHPFQSAFSLCRKEKSDDEVFLSSLPSCLLLYPILSLETEGCIPGKVILFYPYIHLW